jgi:hypothetical protein
MSVGPGRNFNYIQDTIESFFYYTTSSRKIIVLDDSGEEVGKKLNALFPDIIVLGTPLYRRRNAALYYTLCKGFEFACRNYTFDVLLKIDADALLIGKAPEDDAVVCFRQHPEYGSIGSYKIDCTGGKRDFLCHGNKLIEEISDEQLLKHPDRASGIGFLRRVLQKSLKNGYEPGEHCQGGAHFISRECIVKLYENDLFVEREIFWTQLEDDVLFGLFMYSVGLKHGDLATGSLPVGVRCVGLPCSPENLVANNKKITHSTRFYMNLSEEMIRDFFI